MKKIRDKSFQTLLVLAIASLIIWFFYKKDWLIYISLGFLLIGLVNKPLSDKIAWVWDKFAHVLGWVNSRLVLGIIFFVVLTPLALIFRVFSKDSLQLNRKKEGSYFSNREHLYKAADLTKTW